MRGGSDFDKTVAEKVSEQTASPRLLYSDKFRKSHSDQVQFSLDYVSLLVPRGICCEAGSQTGGAALHVTLP